MSTNRSLSRLRLALAILIGPAFMLFAGTLNPGQALTGWRSSRR